MCRCAEHKLSALHVMTSEENELNATTQQSITAEISSCALKQRSKTHSSLLQSNLQLQNQAQGRRQRGYQWCPPPPFEICTPHFTFGPLVAAYIQYSIFKMWPPFCFLAPPSDFWPPLLLNPGNWQDQAALMSCRIRAIEHRKCAAGLSQAHPGLQDRLLINYTKLRMRIKCAR